MITDLELQPTLYFDWEKWREYFKDEFMGGWIGSVMEVAKKRKIKKRKRQHPNPDRGHNKTDRKKQRRPSPGRSQVKR